MLLAILLLVLISEPHIMNALTSGSFLFPEAHLVYNLMNLLKEIVLHGEKSCDSMFGKGNAILKKF